MDVYALGLLLHELLSGLLPFAKRYEDREDGTVLLHKRFTEEIPPLSLTQPISPQLQALLRQMLARDAAVRPAHAGMVRERFRDIPEIQAISSTLPERSGQMVIPSSALSGGAEGQTTSATVSALSLVERGTLFPVLLALTIVATLLTFAYLLFGPPHS